MQNSRQGRLPNALGSLQGLRLSAPRCATFSPVPPRLVKTEVVRQIFPGQNNHTYEVPVPPDGLQKPPAHSFLIPRVRSSVDAEKLGSGLRSAPVARPLIGPRGPRLHSARL